MADTSAPESHQTIQSTPMIHNTQLMQQHQQQHTAIARHYSGAGCGASSIGNQGATLGLADRSSMVSPSSHHQPQQQQQQPPPPPPPPHNMQETYQESALIAVHNQRHQLQQQQQQQQQQVYHSHLAPSDQSTNSSTYYDATTYQDHYNSGHRANIDPYHQPSPTTMAHGPHQAPSSAGTQCWSNLSQSTSPQIATSPAIMNHQFHLGTHQNPPNQAAPPSPYHDQFHLGTHQNPPNQITAPASPYHANATYTNGYPQQPLPPHHQHHHHHHQHHHQQQQQQQQQQSQHYIPHPQLSHHQHHQHHQQQQQHQAINMQPSHVIEEVFTQQHHHHHAAPVTYNQFSSRGSLMADTSAKHQHQSIQSTPMLHNTQLMQQQHQHQQTSITRHYSSVSCGPININGTSVDLKSSSNSKMPTTTTTTTTSENLTLNIRAGSVGVTSSPKPTQQNILPSPPSIGAGQGVNRRQSSSVVSTTSSAGSNLSDHQSPNVSPSNVPPLQNVPQTWAPEPIQTSSNTKVYGAARLVSTEDRLSTGVTDTEQDSKESQLSQLHQQCAVLLDEQQQSSIAINSSNLNNNGTSASNSVNNNNNNNNSSSNGNNSGRSKRLRTSFKHNQLKEMKRWFSRNQNPDAKDLKTLAQTTGLSKRVLQVWFQNARAKFRRNNAKAANQQLYDVNQHTSHMLQFQQQQHQQQNYHHHHHLHHNSRPMVDGQPMNSQQIGPHLHLPTNQESPTTLVRAFAPMSSSGGGVEGGHQVGTIATNTHDLQQPSTTATTTSG